MLIRITQNNRMMVRLLSFLVFTYFWLITDSYVRLPRSSSTFWQSLTRYFDASEDGSNSFIDDDKRRGALQPSMTDIRAASAVGTSNRPPLSNEVMSAQKTEMKQFQTRGHAGRGCSLRTEDTLEEGARRLIQRRQ